MLKIRRPLGRLIFNMGIAIPGKTVFLIETKPSATFSLIKFEDWMQGYGISGKLVKKGQCYINYRNDKLIIQQSERWTNIMMICKSWIPVKIDNCIIPSSLGENIIKLSSAAAMLQIM